MQRINLDAVKISAFLVSITTKMNNISKIIPIVATSMPLRPLRYPPLRKKWIIEIIKQKMTMVIIFATLYRPRACLET